MILSSKSITNTFEIAYVLGRKLCGGEVLELIGDLGSGKTVFVKGLARGVISKDVVQSPSFTIERRYRGQKGITIYHYDFYRLDDPGVVAKSLAEALTDPKGVIAVEWGKVVENVLPKDRLQVKIEAGESEEERKITLRALGPQHQKLIKDLK